MDNDWCGLRDPDDDDLVHIPWDDFYEEVTMGKVRGKVHTQWQGEDLYQSLKKQYEGEYSGLGEVDGVAEAEAEVRAYFGMVAKELEEGLQ